MRYIDADKLQERLQEEFDKEGAKADEMAMCGCAEASVKYNHGQFCYLNAKELVKDAPTADVVEVVRCKDCIKKDTPKCAMWYDCEKCKGQWSWCNPNDFCSYGERSENGKGTDN